MEDRIEVIVGCYKQEKWLKDALWSATNQIIPFKHDYPPSMYPPSFDFFTVKVVHDNCRVTSGGVIYDGKGTGASAARNRAIKESSADWIIWLDADDMLSSNYLKAMYDSVMHTFVNERKVIHMASVQFIEGARLDRLGSCFLYESDNPLHREWHSGLQRAKRYPMCMSAMFPKKAWEEVGGFDESMTNMEDLDFWVRCGYAGYKFQELPYSAMMLRRNVPGSLIDKGVAKEKESLEYFNKKHGTRLTHSLLPYRVPMRNEC